MIKQTVIFLLAFSLVWPGAVLAQKLSNSQIKKYKAEIAKRQKEVSRLQKKLKAVKTKKQKQVIQDKINSQQEGIKAIKSKLYPKPPAAKKKPVLSSSFETMPEEMLLATNEAAEKKRLVIGLRNEVGLMAGLYAGVTSIVGETRLPLNLVLGPAVPSLRVTFGFGQSETSGRKYLPLGFDLVFNYPPGWFSGVDSYFGAGLNYLIYTSGRTAGTIGGQVFYGVQSEGFGGVVFAELGYAMIRTGFSPSEKGTTVLVGYRQLLGI